MKTIKEGRKPTEFWPWNKTISCNNCDGAYQLEEDKDQRFIQVQAAFSDPRGDEEPEKRFVRFDCPNCGHVVVSYAAAGDVFRDQFYKRHP